MELFRETSPTVVCRSHHVVPALADIASPGEFMQSLPPMSLLVGLGTDFPPAVCFSASVGRMKHPRLGAVVRLMAVCVCVLVYMYMCSSLLPVSLINTMTRSRVGRKRRYLA